jgi:hypothetical protein
MNKVLVAGVLAGALLSGCATTYPTASIQSSDPSPDQIDLTPPVPSFTTIWDCELAYGAGTCGTGAALYQTAGIVVPSDAYGWYAPYAFGVMTGVLLNHYFAPPAVYVSGFQYRSFTSTTVINNYKVINQTTINNFKQAPASVRNQAMRAGPVGYLRSKGAITGPARFAGSTVSHTQSLSYPKAANVLAQRLSASASSSTYSAHSNARSTASTYAPSPYTPSRNSSSTSSYSAPARASTSYAAPTRSATPAYAPTRQAMPTYTPPRTPTPYSARQTNSAKVCKTYPCR